MTQGALDFTAAPEPSQAETMAPSAIQARRSGRARVGAVERRWSMPTPSMLVYRDALQRFGPCTDQELAERSGLPLASVCGRRNDWLWLRPYAIAVVDRKVQQWATGKSTTRTVWRWVEMPAAEVQP